MHGMSKPMPKDPLLWKTNTIPSIIPITVGFLTTGFQCHREGCTNLELFLYNITKRGKTTQRSITYEDEHHAILFSDAGTKIQIFLL